LTRRARRAAAAAAADPASVAGADGVAVGASAWRGQRPVGAGRGPDGREWCQGWL